MKLIAFIVILLSGFIPGLAIAQTLSANDLLGKWTFCRQALDTVMIFDSSRPQYMVDMHMNRMRKFKPGYTSQDSLNVLENVQDEVENFSKIFIQFNSDGTCIQTRINDPLINEETQEGNYTLTSPKEISIRTGENSSTTYGIALNNDLLQLILKQGGHEFIMEYKKDQTFTVK
jgi:hypothetical protein